MPTTENTIVEVGLTNTTEHVLHILLADGEILTIPPLEKGLDGITMNLAAPALQDSQFLPISPVSVDRGPKGLTVKLDAKRKAVFDRALATPTVKAWLASGELIVGDPA